MWKPSDFIIFGKYCDTKSVHSKITQIREWAKSEAVILFVVQETTFFQSLLLISHEKPDTERDIQNYLVKDPIEKEHLHIPIRESNTNLINFLGNLVNKNPFYKLVEYFGKSVKINTFYKKPSNDNNGTDEGSIGASILIIIINPQDIPSKKEYLDKHLADLFYMVNACAPIVVHRGLSHIKTSDLAIERVETDLYKQEKQLGIDISESDEMQSYLSNYAKALLLAATELTKSSVGNLYITSSDSRRLILSAEVNNEKPVKEINIEDVNSIVAYVYKRRRPLLINNIGEFQNMHPHLNYIWVGPGDEGAYAELAVPIVQRNLSSKHYTILGVLNVEKMNKHDSGFYSGDDLNIMRDIALRFCLFRSRTLLSLTSGYLAGLTRRNIILDEEQSLENSLPKATEDKIPLDLTPAKSSIEEAVKKTFELTRSRSATVRLLSADGLTLIRYCAFPLSALDDPSSYIKIKNFESVNAWTARNGKECYIRNLNADKPFKGYENLLGFLVVRDRIQSALCLPIFVNGRIVGTFNLESEYIDAYSESIGFARAVAEQIGLALSQARRSIEQIVLSISATTTFNVHQLLKCRDALIDISRYTTKSVHNAILKIHDKINSCVDPPKLDKLPFSYNLEKTIINAIEELEFGSLVKLVTKPKKVYHLNQVTADLFRKAFQEVLFDSCREALPIPKGDVRLHIKERNLGGASYILVEIVNSVRHKIPDKLAKQLYRIPHIIDRIHIGAFVAGSLLRAIGGDIYLRRNENNIASTVIEIPIK